MGAGDLFAAARRLKREDYKQTKHDAIFSKWQVLVGPNDWEDYSKGKEGVEKYRIQNLPNKTSPGLYELGIAVVRTGLGRDVGKLDPDDMVVAYLGQADNVRTRLQRYGRSGAHLANIYSSGSPVHCQTEPPKKGPGLFEEIFSRGYSIVFRWAPMKSKRDAEKTEAQLLHTFDYAWNKDSNGVRRPDDLLKKLTEVASRTSKFSNIFRLHVPFVRKKVGIRIEGNKLILQEKKSSADASEESNNLPGIFNFSRSRPRLVSNELDNNLALGSICGVILNDGTSCTRPPVPGRKRCKEHKGRKTYGFNLKPITKEESGHIPDACVDSSPCGHQSIYGICGVILGNGTICRRPPSAGRKRCVEHKGMRVTALLSKSEAKEKSQMPDSSLTGTHDLIHNDIYSQTLKDSNSESPPFSGRCAGDRDSSTICGATLRNGSFCRRRLAKGNERCWQHRG